MTPDEFLCLWKDTCPRARLCYRATAISDEVHQTYSADGKPGEGCQYFIPNGWAVPSAIAALDISHKE